MPNLENLGNSVLDKPKNKIVQSYKPVHEKDKATVKIYSMLDKETTPFADLEIYSAKSFIGQLLIHGKIEPKFGSGFAILSEDILNINMWEGDCPLLSNINIYSFSRRVPPNKPIVDWEHQYEKSIKTPSALRDTIVGHEIKAWGEYMLSKRTKEDKSSYFDNVFSGKTKEDSNPIPLYASKEYLEKCNEYFERCAFGIRPKKD